jgi:hypothetical protein
MLKIKMSNYIFVIRQFGILLEIRNCNLEIVKYDFMIFTHIILQEYIACFLDFLPFLSFP